MLRARNPLLNCDLQHHVSLAWALFTIFNYYLTPAILLYSFTGSVSHCTQSALFYVSVKCTNKILIHSHQNPAYRGKKSIDELNKEQ